MIGRVFSHYKILNEIGRGGMGIVYRALDVKLNREVALKILPPELVLNPERKRRFVQEAQAAAALRHSNIAVIYEIDDVDDVTFIAMELIEGQKLSDLLASGRLPLSRALGLAVEVAEALSRAHEKGIVHRDLKPANIMVAQDSHAKIIDFGLAKLLEPLGDGESQLETAIKGETEAGRVMGTLSYMSPEQARGKEVDHRSDIFSFGTVLYEILTGRLPFVAQSAAEMPHAIIHASPSPLGESVAGSVVPELQRIVSKCLAKDPEERYQTAKDLWIDLRGAKRDSASQPEGVITRAPEPPVARRRAVAGLGSFLLLVSVIGIVLLRSAPDTVEFRIERTRQLTREAGLEMDPAISADGKLIAYAAGPLGNTKIYVQQIAGGRAIALTADFRGSHYWPQFSPDGAHIAFGALHQGRDEIYVVPALGGVPRRLTDAAGGCAVGHVWSPDGMEIAYGDGCENSIYRVAVAGGEPEKILMGPIDVGALAWSPDGTQIAYAAGNDGYIGSGDFIANIAPSSLWTVAVAGGDSVRVTEDIYLDHSPVWSPDGKHLLFVSDRGGSRDIYRVPIGADGAPSGPPARLTTGLNVHTMGVSADGARLAYSVLTTQQNIWSVGIPDAGSISLSDATQITTGNQAIEGIDVSPDGKWLAFDSNRSGNQDIYKMPVEGGEPIQLTNDPADDFLPAWSPDQEEIAFHSYRTGNRDLFLMSSDGGAVRQLTEHPAHDRYPDWSPDGKEIVFHSERTGRQELHVISRDRGELAGEAPRQLTRDGGMFPKWSPDGRSIAFFDLGGVSIISPQGGDPRRLWEAEGGLVSPAWSPDSQRLYYKWNPGHKASIWSAPVAGGDPERLLELDDPMRVSHRPEWATDAKRFYFTLTEHESDLWVMELAPDER